MSKILVRIATFTSELLGRPLTNYEINQLVSFVESNKKYVCDVSSSKFVAEMSKAYADYLEGVEKTKNTEGDAGVGVGVEKADEVADAKNTTGLEGFENTAGLLEVANADLVNFLGLDTFDKFISVINPVAKKNRAYMCLDSRYARFNPQCTKLTWDFTNNLNVVNHSTNVSGVVRDITSIRMRSMVVRSFASTPQRATIFIEELAAQSFSMPSGRKFHFVGLLNDLQNPVNVGLRNAVGLPIFFPDPQIWEKYELLAGYKFNDGYYRFNKPITTLNDITISIGNPDTLVVIPKYEFKNVLVTNATDSLIDLDFEEPHNYIANSPYPDQWTYLNGYYSVFIDEFLTGDPTYVDYENYINSHEFTSITITGANTIQIRFYDIPYGINDFYTTPPVLNVQPGPIPPGPWPRVRVRWNTFRTIMNFELEYISNE